MVTACDSDSGPDLGLVKDFETIYSGETEVLAPVGERYTYESTIRDQNSLTESDVVITIEGQYTEVRMEQVSEFEVKFSVTYYPQTAKDTLTIHIGGRDNSGFELSKRSIHIAVQPHEDVPGIVQVIGPTRGLGGQTLQVAFIAIDPNGLDRITFANSPVARIYGTTTQGTVTVSLPLQTGVQTMSGQMEDRDGNVSEFSFEVEVVGRMPIDLLFRTFFSKSVGIGSLELVLDDPEISWDSTLVAEPNGWIHQRAPIGRYWATVRPPNGASTMARMFLTREMTDDLDAHFVSDGTYYDISGTLAPIPGEVTYGVSGVGSPPFRLSIERPLTTFVEYVADAGLSDKMARQLEVNTFKLFDTRETVTFLVYTGNPACTGGFNGMDPCSDGGTLPPGSIATPKQIENHGLWYEHNTALLADPLVGGNPYKTRRIVVDDQNIVSEAGLFNSLRIAGKRNTSISYFTTGLAHDYWSFSTRISGVTYSLYTAALILGDRMGATANGSQNAFGSFNHPVGNSVCSVRNQGTSASEAECPTIPENRVQYLFDDQFVQVSSAFGTFPQYQRTPSGRGFNLKIR